MAVIKNKQRFIFVVLGLLCLLLFVSALLLHLSTFSKHPKKTRASAHMSRDKQDEGSRVDVKREPVRLPKQMSVENELKIEVEPVHVSEDQVQFTLTLASYQNSESVGMNPLETTILLDEEDTPYAPIQWDVSQEDEYNKVGTLTFSLAHFPKSLRLSIFELEERTFEWSLAVPDGE